MRRQVAREEVPLTLVRTPEPDTSEHPGPCLGDHHEGGIRRGGNAVGEAQPLQHNLGLGLTDPKPQQPPGAGVLDEVGLPLLDAPLGTGVREPDRPVRCDRGVVAEAHSPTVNRVGENLDRPSVQTHREQPAVGVAHQDATLGQPLQTQWSPTGVPDPTDRVAVRADRQDGAVRRARVGGAVVADENVLGAGAGHGDDGEFAHDRQPRANPSTAGPERRHPRR